MDLWIRSTARTNLLKVRFLTIMEGKNFYEKDRWEFKGYTICNCNEQGIYELLGTYETKERALKILDEIQEILEPQEYMVWDKQWRSGHSTYNISSYVYEMPQE